MSTDQPSRMKASIPDGASASLAQGGRLPYLPEPNLPIVGSGLGAAAQGIEQLGGNIAQFGLAVAAQRKETKNRDDMVEADTLLNQYQIEYAQGVPEFQKQFAASGRDVEEYEKAFDTEFLSPLQQRYASFSSEKKFSKEVAARYLPQLTQYGTRGKLEALVDAQGYQLVKTSKTYEDAHQTRLALIQAKGTPGGLNDVIAQEMQQYEAMKPFIATLPPEQQAKFEARHQSNVEEYGVAYIDGVMRTDLEQAQAMVEDPATVSRLFLSQQTINKVWSGIAASAQKRATQLNTSFGTSVDNLTALLSAGNTAEANTLMVDIANQVAYAQKLGVELSRLPEFTALSHTAALFSQLPPPTAISLEENRRQMRELRKAVATGKNAAENLKAFDNLAALREKNLQTQLEDPLATASSSTEALQQQVYKGIPPRDLRLLSKENTSRILGDLMKAGNGGTPEHITEAYQMVAQLKQQYNVRIPNTSMTQFDVVMNQLYGAAQTEGEKNKLASYELFAAKGDTPETRRAFLAAMAPVATVKNLLLTKGKDTTYDKYKAAILAGNPVLSAIYINNRQNLDSGSQDRMDRELDLIVLSTLMSKAVGAPENAGGDFNPAAISDSKYIKDMVASFVGNKRVFKAGSSAPVGAFQVFGQPGQTISQGLGDLALDTVASLDALQGALRDEFRPLATGGLLVKSMVKSFDISSLQPLSQRTVLAKNLKAESDIAYPAYYSTSEVAKLGAEVIQSAYARGELALQGGAVPQKTLSPEQIDRAIRLDIFEIEGKSTFVQNDAGQGPTKWGINYQSHAELLRSLGIQNEKQFKQLTQQQAEAAYGVIMAGAQGLNRVVDPKLRSLLSDAYFNSPASYHAMQKAIAGRRVGLSPADPNSIRELDTIYKVAEAARIDYLKKARYQTGDKAGQLQWPDFGAGWTARIQKVSTKGQSLRDKFYADTKTQLGTTNKALYRRIGEKGALMRSLPGGEGIEFGALGASGEFVPFVNARTGNTLKLWWEKK